MSSKFYLNFKILACQLKGHMHFSSRFLWTKWLHSYIKWIKDWWLGGLMAACQLWPVDAQDAVQSPERLPGQRNCCPNSGWGMHWGRRKVQQAIAWKVPFVCPSQKSQCIEKMQTHSRNANWRNLNFITDITSTNLWITVMSEFSEVDSYRKCAITVKGDA